MVLRTYRKVMLMSNDLYDKYGYPIREYDVLKVYHFTGRRRKKHYMYKWVRCVNGHLYGSHLHSDKHDGYLLTQASLKNTEIVQGYNCKDGELDFKDRPRIQMEKFTNGSTS